MNDNTKFDSHASAPTDGDQPETLRNVITNTAVIVACALIRIVFTMVAVATAPMGLYYFFESIGAHGAANIVANSAVIGLVIGLIVTVCVLPILVVSRIVRMFQDGDQS